MADGFSGLDPCVHCGFCLPACPTFLATGDESDSPRGRIVLMRALERGELPAHDEALREHLDACLGCRGCEPVCPSGVEYGRGLEAAREILAERGGLGTKARSILAVFRRRWLWWPLFTLARVFRSTGLPRLFAGAKRTGFSVAMLASTAPGKRSTSQARGSKDYRVSHRQSVVLFRGCVMDRLLGHVHDATRRTLVANGYRVVEARFECCGALHLHAGDRRSAIELARSNLRAMVDAVDYVVVNSAGCGAILKDYGHLLDTAEAALFASKVRDVTQLLAAVGPRQGESLDLRISYDAPCHLQHAQKVHAEVLAVFNAIPDTPVTLLPGYDKCCGSAGIFSMLQPEMSRAVLDMKISTITAAEPEPQVIATGNPGCLMQIGAGLLAAGSKIRVVHPVELLDWSYSKAGLYR